MKLKNGDVEIFDFTGAKIVLMELVCSCKTSIPKAEVWILKSIKDFESRKLIIGYCPKCHRPVSILLEKRIIDGAYFRDMKFGNEAMKVINAETKRMLCKYYKIDSNSLNGWIYGINIEIKNKSGQTKQIRQYASDFKGNKSLVKKIIT